MRKGLQIRLNDKGTTMVELMVGFTLLLLLLGILTGIVRVSSNLIMNATDGMKQRQQFQQELFQTSSSGYDTTAIAVTFRLQEEGGTGDTISLNRAGLSLLEDKQSGLFVYLLEYQ